MGKILTLSNQKGGTSKSTSAVHLGAALKIMGKKVLIVDFDPQGDASTYLGYEEESSDTVSQMIERFVRGKAVEEKNNLARMMIKKIYISVENDVDIHYYF